MEILERIKNEVAVKHGWVGETYLLRHASNSQKSEFVNEVATEFAKKCCDLQIDACRDIGLLN